MCVQETKARLELVLDTLYAEQPEVWPGQVFTAATLAEIAEELAGYCKRLPGRSLSRGELSEALNRMLDADGRTASLGHIR